MLHSLDDVRVDISVVLGIRTMAIRDVLRLGKGAVLPLGTLPDSGVTLESRGKKIGVAGVSIDAQGVISVLVTKVENVSGLT